MTTTEISALFNSLSDEELARRVASGDLTEVAFALAAKELTTRGLDVPSIRSADVEPEFEYQGDPTIVARHLTPTEAHLLSSCLNAAGVPAEVGNANFGQLYSLIAGAFGGANVRVPANFLLEAEVVMAAFKRGDFELNDGFNPNE